jgi:hypothetical protein
LKVDGRLSEWTDEQVLMLWASVLDGFAGYIVNIDRVFALFTCLQLRGL